jgi:hypothetical protein
VRTVFCDGNFVSGRFGKVILVPSSHMGHFDFLGRIVPSIDDAVSGCQNDVGGHKNATTLVAISTPKGYHVGISSLSSSTSSYDARFDIILFGLS